MSMRGMVLGFLRFFVLACVFGFTSLYAEAANVTCSGKAVDEAGKPVNGVKVTLYQIVPDIAGMELKNVTTEEQITKEDGGFSFSGQMPEERQYRFAMLIATKDGLAMGWDNWQLKEDKVTTLTMGKPYTLSGVVVDEAGQPVGGAEVRISMLLIGSFQGGSNQPKYLISTDGLDLLKVTTNANGTFAFNAIPTEAKAEFMAKKAGRATISTFNMSSSGGYNPGQYNVQSSNIRIVMPAESKIEGKVVDKGSGNGVGGVKLMCGAEKGYGGFGAKPVVSRDDGTFSFDGLEAKTYRIIGVPARDKPAEWVLKPATVTTTAGQTSSGVNVEASTGGMLEVTIRDNDKNPIAGANVYAAKKGSNMEGCSGISNADGIAAIRLVPGEYQVQGAYKEGFSSFREPQTVTIEEGKTAKLDIELKGSPKITGVVRDPNGRPLAGVSVRIGPGGQRATNSDKDGRFEISWNPEQLGNSRRPNPVVVARHAGLNLAAAVGIEEDTKTVDVNLTPGIIVTGKVVDPNGKPIAGATAMANLNISNWGMNIDDIGVTTDKDGRYEYVAIPVERKYNFSATAQGYGQGYAQVNADNAANGRLEVEPQVLKPATMRVSGIVVDCNDKPVADVQVYVNGQDQQNCHGTTDSEGKFVISNLCEGQIYVNAQTMSGQNNMYAYVNANAGDDNIKIRLKRSGEIQGTNQQAGTLEVVVRDEEKNLVAQRRVLASPKAQDGASSVNGTTDANGLATLKLAPGEYKLQTADEYDGNYRSVKDIKPIAVEEGKTVRVEVEIKAPRKITGVIRDPNGQPVAKATIQTCPMMRNEVSSDKDGRFEILWDPERWDGKFAEPVLIARHARRNLAVFVEFDEDKKIVDVSMAPGVVIRGEVVDPNSQPIAFAKIYVNLRSSDCGTLGNTNITADQQGRYEYKAVPKGQIYNIAAQAEGYGQSYIDADADEAVNGIVEVKPLMLQQAEISISGIVVDVNDKPVVGAEVQVNGRGQSYRRGTTDAQGKFTIRKLCEGQVQIYANYQNGQNYMHGNVSAKAGDTDIKLLISSQSSGAQKQPKIKKVIDPEQFEQTKQTLVTLAQSTNKQELEAAIDKAKAAVNKSGVGHVIVGRVVVDGQGDAGGVRAQMEILPDGCFAAATKDLVGPVGFRMHRYAPYDLQLKGMEGDLVDVGTFHMTPVPEDQLAGLKGKVVLEGSGDASGIVVCLGVARGPLNALSGVMPPRPNWPDDMKIQAAEGGLIEASGFSPFRYMCKVTAPGYLEKIIYPDFSDGQMVDLGTVKLEIPRQISLSYIVAEEPPFALQALQTVSIPAGTKWKAVDGDYAGCDLEFTQDRGVVILKSSSGPCYLRDMGKGEISDHVNVDKTRVGEDQLSNQKARNGHVYLLDQKHFKRWVLFKIVME